MKARLQAFWEGRLGSDALNRFLVLLWAILALLNLWAHATFLYIFELCLGAYAVFRMLSKNLVRRRRECAVYYALSRRVKAFFGRLYLRVRDRKTTRYFACPHCRASIRMPRKVGTFRIRCPRCGGTFDKEFRR